NAGPLEMEFARHSNSLWPGFAKEIEAESSRSIGYDASGALLLAKDALALDRLARQAASRPDLELVDPGRVCGIAPLVTGVIAGGLWSAKEARVNNRALGLAMAIAFQKAGGTLKPNEAVVRIERREGRAAIAHTPFGLYHADAFILAAGAWSGLLEEKLAPIVPVKGQMILLSPPAGAPMPDCVIWGNGIYAVPRKEGLAVGATAEEVGFDTGITDEARDFLLDAAKAVMPSLKDWTVEDQWAGLRPKAPDGLPLLGPTAVEGLWLAGGQYRNGILFAPAIAETMCRQILGGPGIAAFDPRRFPS
ncbi:MAG TPA: FAD-dependent oxidoreductase, partial [Rhizomicrobium sp.]|nr:FAD-dependent oxidoreductase [Rhizomicrobium sp.]